MPWNHDVCLISPSTSGPSSIFHALLTVHSSHNMTICAGKEWQSLSEVFLEYWQSNTCTVITRCSFAQMVNWDYELISILVQRPCSRSNRKSEWLAALWSSSLLFDDSLRSPNTALLCIDMVTIFGSYGEKFPRKTLPITIPWLKQNIRALQLMHLN